MIGHPLRINLIARDNGLGLSRDAALLAEALKANGCLVHLTPLDETDEQRRWRYGRPRRALYSHWRHALARLRKRTDYDVNIMFEHLWPLHLPLARYNVALPNPEWFDARDLRHLRRIDRVWAKTKHAQALFQQFGRKTSLVGFDSDDRYDPDVPRRRRFFHLAGGSRIKGTEQLLALWRKHPEWPELTVVQNPSCAQTIYDDAHIKHRVEYIDAKALRDLQNAHLFHICLSETEGWGHYILEGMSVGAVVITVDAGPMNEHVTADRGVLVAYDRTGSMGQATTYHFSETDMERAVTAVLQMSDAQLHALGARARQWFLRNHATFAQRIGVALAELSA
jgi:glycosyltransferase involved in cell wall biosynthesis